MIVIKLFCNAGMSTSLLVHKMQASAKEQDLDVAIKAYPVTAIMNELPSADVVLLGPQVVYKEADTLKLAKPLGIPVAVIDLKDYGMLNGKGVLEKALKLVHKAV